MTRRLVVVLTLAAGVSLSAQAPGGWRKTGSAPERYEIGVDKSEHRSGTASGVLKSDRAGKAFGTLMQTFLADEYRGKRLRMRAYLKVKDVREQAQMWMRVDGAERTSIAFDNMLGRALTGTREWAQYSIVLDVAQEAVMISFGSLLIGAGTVWIDDVTFDVVGSDVASTNLGMPPNRKAEIPPGTPPRPVNPRV